MLPSVPTDPLAGQPPFDWPVRLAFGVVRGLSRIGLYPSSAQMAAMTVAKRRAASRPAGWMTYPMPETVTARTFDIPSRGGPLPIRWYARRNASGPARRPVLFIHGGGWIMGCEDSLDYFCANLADRLGAPVASVGYRLAPDHPCPAALEDCEDALAWLCAGADGAIPATASVTVAGDSAGGNLTAALCLLERERGLGRIACQVLIYPALDLTMGSPSMAIVDGGLTREDMASVAGHYRGKLPATDPRVSPMFASRHAGLPPTVIVTAGRDPLRDDGLRYAHLLHAAGVPLYFKEYPGMPHGFLSTPRLVKGAPAALVELVTEIDRHSDLPA